MKATYTSVVYVTNTYYSLINWWKGDNELSAPVEHAVRALMRSTITTIVNAVASDAHTMLLTGAMLRDILSTSRSRPTLKISDM